MVVAALKIDEDLYVQCFGECKERGEHCTLGFAIVRDSDEEPESSAIEIRCKCFEDHRH
jgi:hypothetical protein